MKTADGHEITVGMEVWIRGECGAFLAEIVELNYLSIDGCCKISHTETCRNDFAHEWDIFTTRIAALNSVVERLEDSLRYANRELQEAEHEALKLQI